MARAKPFNFDFSFDDGADERRKAAEMAKRQAAEEAEANRPPTFSVEELEQARAEAHALGRQEGMADASAGIEQQAARTLDMMFSRLPKVFEEYAAWTKTMETDALRLALAVMRKLGPQLTRDRELPEVERVIREAFGFLTEQPKVMVRVAPAIAEALGDRVTLMASRVGYEGQVVLVGDPELPTDDCRVSWQAGAVERSMDDTWAQIDRIVEHAMAGQPQRVRTAETAPADIAAEAGAEETDGEPQTDEAVAAGDAEQSS